MRNDVTSNSIKLPITTFQKNRNYVKAKFTYCAVRAFEAIPVEKGFADFSDFLGTLKFQMTSFTPTKYTF